MRKRYLALVTLTLALTGCAAGSSDKATTIAKEETTGISTTEAVAEATSLAEEVTTVEETTIEETTAKEETTKLQTTEEPTTEEPAPVTQPHEEMNYDEYSLVWEDNFDTEISSSDWRYELHKPGWVNAELQEYVKSDENVYIEDGKLVIKPIKTVDEMGNAYYTSGRINTMGKHDFKYGIIEASIKMPAGKGFLPAFWLMPTEQGRYGNWPKCGEIDIAEILGNKPLTTYGTIHYGLPHMQNQGKYTLSEGSFTEEFHTYAVEWLPGAINWYVDGQLYYTTSEWYTKNEGSKAVPYPAPFNQKFYIILNLAVGGNWPGNPDDTTDFENAKMEVDYVRVYQKEHYNENVSLPEVKVELRDPDASGNYVVNGDFSIEEELNDESDWTFLQAMEGIGTATIEEGTIKITTENEGTVDYSIQLVAWNIPAANGAKYKVSFDAWASEDRTMLTGVTAPSKNYIRYFGDELVSLTTEKQHFEYEFTMSEDDDANARLEFNMGKAGSTADIYISNVRIEKV